ncbi:iron ABC transporter permease [Gulosibacter sp. 10]|uniref:ABC transporter permease n=1 Tax=Gulosibacter sp. 10 TaxID=1255570 RepID=UPI00097F3631|nr:iron ABC transporter permease [Gulosibacter sp. 10]SJM51262.1 Thiamin ABC transporter, transmembrane component [Gulosibacter sp. 10]
MTRAGLEPGGRLRRIPARIAWTVAIAVPLAFLAVFFAWPVGAILLRGIVADGRVDLGAFGDVLGAGRTYRILAQTLWMAFAGTLGSVLLGIPGAYILYRCRFPGRAVLRGLATVPFVLPTVVVGMAFRALLSERGPLGFLGLDGTTTAVVLAMIFFNFSVVVRQVGTLWATLDPRTAEAARTLGASPFRAFRTVTLPRLGPAIASAGSLVFLYCSTAFGIVLTLGSPGYGTLETEIYLQTRVHLDLPVAAVLSILQFLIVLAAVIVSNRVRLGTETSLRLRETKDAPLGRADAWPAAITFATIGILILSPLAALVVRSFQRGGEWSLGNYALLATSGSGFAGGATVLQALEHSLRIALDAAVIALVIGIPLALVLSRRSRSPGVLRTQRVIDGAVMLPLGVSAVTVGFGFIVSLQAWSPQLAHSGLLVPLAQAVVALPLVVRSLVPVLRAIDPRLREAAMTLGASPGRVLRTVDGPFLVRGLGLAAGFAFAVSLGEFGATSFLASPNYVTLPVLIVRLLGRPGADNYGMALAGAVILAVVTATVMIVCERLRPRGVREGQGW